MGKNVTKSTDDGSVRSSNIRKFIRTSEFRKILIFVLTVIVLIILTNLPARADDTVVGLGPGEVSGEESTEELWTNAPEDVSYTYLGIPLTTEDVDLMARMAMAETMWHDGTSPEITARACYEVAFNRFLYDQANGTKLFHRKGMSMSSFITKSGEFAIASQSRFNKLPEEWKAAYRNLVWQVHNQGPTVLIPQSDNGYTNIDFKYWQSKSGYGGRDKANALWVGWIYNDAGEIVPGVIPYTEKWRLVGTVKGLSYLGNWYRINYK